MPKKKLDPSLECQHCGKQMTTEILYHSHVNVPLTQKHIAMVRVSCKCGSPKVGNDRMLYASVTHALREGWAPNGQGKYHHTYDAPLFPHAPVILDTTSCPSSCPVCGKDTADYDSVEVDDEVASQAGSCPTCGSEWTEHYRISSRVIIVNGKKKK